VTRCRTSRIVDAAIDFVVDTVVGEALDRLVPGAVIARDFLHPTETGPNDTIDPRNPPAPYRPEAPAAKPAEAPAAKPAEAPAAKPAEAPAAPPA